MRIECQGSFLHTDYCVQLCDQMSLSNDSSRSLNILITGTVFTLMTQCKYKVVCERLTHFTCNHNLKKWVNLSHITVLSMITAQLKFRIIFMHGVRTNLFRILIWQKLLHSRRWNNDHYSNKIRGFLLILLPYLT